MSHANLQQLGDLLVYGDLHVTLNTNDKHILIWARVNDDIIEDDVIMLVCFSRVPAYITPTSHHKICLSNFTIDNHAHIF